MKSVTICSSNRFAKEAIAFAEKLKAIGVNVYLPHYYTHNYGDLEKVDSRNKKFIAMGLTYDHFQKIRQGEIVFIFNKDGYVGPSTTMEIGFAVALGKTIYALAHDANEVCRDILFKDIVKTPKELIKKLK